MRVEIYDDVKQMGAAGARNGAQSIRDAIAEKGAAYIIVATGSSQFATLEALVNEPDIDWSKVHGYHLDEYRGLTMDHPASFRGYLKERFVSKVPLGSFRYINGEIDLDTECVRLKEEISDIQIDVAFVGIGENGHLAFNDPPADFDTEEPYIVAKLDEACRTQQVNEGWFESLDAVPTHAISMSIKQIMKAHQIICTVPDERKAQAALNTVEGEVTPNVPASILQKHDNVTLYLDRPAASLLDNQNNN